jgi:ElaB/YqjD/DUF883 family membrane-anchored ribosome-binding protein
VTDPQVQTLKDTLEELKDTLEEVRKVATEHSKKAQNAEAAAGDAVEDIQAQREESQDRVREVRGKLAKAGFPTG